MKTIEAKPAKKAATKAAPKAAKKIEKIVEPKVAAKPAKTPAAKPVEVTPAPRPSLPTRDQIAQLARTYWAARGYTDGQAEQDWLRAERDLLQKAS